MNITILNETIKELNIPAQEFGKIAYGSDVGLAMLGTLIGFSLLVSLIFAVMMGIWNKGDAGNIGRWFLTAFVPIVLVQIAIYVLLVQNGILFNFWSNIMGVG